MSSCFQVCPSAPPSSVCKSLSQIQNINDVEDLSVKELKCILSANFVDFKGCCEKKELLDRVRTLWKSKQEVNKKKSKSWVLALLTVILLQIVMVSPGTHFVKNHESLSITNQSQLKKTRNPKLTMLLL